MPTSRRFVIARVVMGSATFFDAFNALSIAFVFDPCAALAYHGAAGRIMIGANYVGQTGGRARLQLGGRLLRPDTLCRGGSFMLSKGCVDSVFLMFAALAMVGLLGTTRVIETRNLRLEEIAR